MPKSINTPRAEYRATVSRYTSQLAAIKETRFAVRLETGNDPLADFIRDLSRLIREKFFQGEPDSELPRFWRIFFNIGELAGLVITLIRAIIML